MTTDDDAVMSLRNSAEQGDVYAQHNLAVRYDLGEGIQQDHAQAVYWYSKAAEQGNLDSYLYIVLTYLRGGIGVRQDKAEALKWLNKGNEIAQKRYGHLKFETSEAREAWERTATPEQMEDRRRFFDWASKATILELNEFPALLTNPGAFTKN